MSQVRLIKRPKSPKKLRAFLQTIAARQNSKSWRNPIAQRLGIQAAAVTNWPNRGIPPMYWPLIAELAGVSTDHVAALHEAARNFKG